MNDVRNVLLILTLVALSSTGLGAMDQAQEIVTPQEVGYCWSVTTLLGRVNSGVYNLLLKLFCESFQLLGLNPLLVTPQHWGQHFSGTLLAQVPQDLIPIVAIYNKVLIDAKDALEADYEKALIDVKNDLEDHLGGLCESLEKLLKTYGYDVLVVVLQDYFRSKPGIVSMKNYRGNTVLHVAVGRNNQPVVELLLDAVGERAPELVCIHDNYYNTPLHCAAHHLEYRRRDGSECRSLEAIVKLLLDAAGESLSTLLGMKGYLDKTAQELFEYYNNDVMAQLLRQYSYDNKNQ